MSRLELEASLEAIYLGKMVQAVTEWKTYIGRVCTVAVEGDMLLLQIEESGSIKLARYSTHNYEKAITILNNGDSDGRAGSDVFANI